jgi:branched-chain amino acid transport system substrate-binding protein
MFSALMVLSGPNAPLGNDQLRSIQLVIKARGEKLLGHAVQLDSEDELCTNEGGSIGAQKIVSDPRVIAIFGTSCSGPATVASKIMSDAGLVMVSSSNTAPSLTSVGGKQGSDWHPGYFRTAYNDAGQGRAAATFAYKKLGLTKAATVNSGDTYTQGLTAVFAQVFKELGGQIVQEAAVNKGDTVMGPVLQSVADSGAQLVFMPIYQPESNNLVSQSKKIAAFKNIRLLAADSAQVSSFISAVGTDGIGMYMSGFSLPQGKANDDLVAQYKAAYGEDPVSIYYASSTDAANLLFSTIEKVAVKDTDGTLHIGRQALRDALYATKDFDGLTGKLTCDKFGDCGVGRFQIVQLNDPQAGIEGLNKNVVYTYTPDQ